MHNVLLIAGEQDTLANSIKRTDSYYSASPVYICESPLYHNSEIHNYVLGLRDFSKKIGDTCRMWTQFYSGTVNSNRYYCWEGFYMIAERGLNGKEYIEEHPLIADGIVTGEHTTRLVLTEKTRFKQ